MYVCIYVYIYIYIYMVNGARKNSSPIAVFYLNFFL